MTTIPGTDAQAFVRVHLRHNVWALGADYSLFLIGLSFASPSTILPAFAVYLGAPNVMIGAIPAVMTVGWLLPSLFVASHTEALSRRLPFIMRYTIWERLPFLGMAIVAFGLADRAPALALTTLLAALLVITVVGGVLMPAWMDIIGRTIPMDLRGRFFALSSTVASAGGLAGSFATAAILAAVPAPHGYGVCFLVAALFMGLSYLALAVTREPVVEAPLPRTPLTSYLRRIPDLLRNDRNFSWFLVARGCVTLAAMASGFYTVVGLKVHAASSQHVGMFTALLYGGQIVGNIALGSLADRAGHKLVILIGAVAMILANAVALGASTLSAFMVVFVLVGLFQAATNVSSFNVLLEFAPTSDERPTYVGLGSTSMAPAAFGAPLIAGLVADAWGFETVFVLATGFGLVGLALLGTRVREPRRASR